MPFQHRYSSDGQNNKKTDPGPVTAQGEANDAVAEERTCILEVRAGGQVFAKTFSVSAAVATPLVETRRASSRLAAASSYLI
jgi:hypothetical protein